MSEIQHFEQQVLAQIDAQVELATDDELFAGGYLRGHLSLSAADCEDSGIESLELFLRQVSESLQAAKAELSPSDYDLVQTMWQRFSARYSQANELMS